MATYCLELFSTDRRSDDVRYREYTTSARRAEAFRSVPRIDFTDSSHGIVPSVRVMERGERRKPTIRMLAEHVKANLRLPNKPSRAAQKIRDAAPDMLAELRQCEVDLTEAAAIIRGSGFPGTGSLLEESVQRVRAAIAKAEGRS